MSFWMSQKSKKIRSCESHNVTSEFSKETDFTVWKSFFSKKRRVESDDIVKSFDSKLQKDEFFRWLPLAFKNPKE